MKIIPVDSFLSEASVLSPYVEVGDETFLLKKYLMRPFPQGQIDDPSKQKFNQRLTLARHYVENTFGIYVVKNSEFLIGEFKLPLLMLII